MPEYGTSRRILTGLFQLWARRTDPPFYLGLAAECFARRARGARAPGELVALVDDIIPRVLLGRSVGEAEQINDTYRRALAEAGFTSSVFASEASAGDLARLLDLDTVMYSHFQRALPSYKSTADSGPDGQELLVFASQFALLKWGVEHLHPDVVVAGASSKKFLDVFWMVVPRVETLYLDVRVEPRKTRESAGFIPGGKVAHEEA
jgi:hypothetical protein